MVSTFITAAQMLVANTSIGVSARSFTLIPVASTFIPVTQHGGRGGSPGAFLAPPGEDVGDAEHSTSTQAECKRDPGDAVNNQIDADEKADHPKSGGGPSGDKQQAQKKGD